MKKSITEARILRMLPPNYKGGAAEWRLNNAESFVTTPSKVAMEHQDEVRDLTAQAIMAARRHELTMYRRIEENNARMAWRDANPDADHEARQRAARDGRDF